MTSASKQIALKAAQLLYETDSSNFSYAINKSAKQLNIANPKLFPKQNEVLLELKLLKKLYNNNQAEVQYNEQFNKFWFDHALKLVKLLDIFQPRLVDPLENSILNSDTPVELHIFTTTTEELAVFLMDKKINYQLKEMKVLHNRQNLVNTACFETYIEQILVRMFVFDNNKPAIRPINPIDLKPFRYYREHEHSI